MSPEPLRSMTVAEHPLVGKDDATPDSASMVDPLHVRV
jgi:hypothetical protein